MLTGYLQQSPSLVMHQKSGLLLCVFGHKDGWPINNTKLLHGWQVVGGQRFIASLDGCVCLLNVEKSLAMSTSI